MTTRVILLVVLFMLAPFAHANCPPWMKCGKYRNMISGDSSYDQQVNASTTSSSSTRKEEPVTIAPLDVEKEERRLASELKLAKARSESETKRSLSTRPQTKDGKDMLILDETAAAPAEGK